MVDTATKLPIKSDNKKASVTTAAWHPFDDLRREVDYLFEDFGRGDWLRPLRPINLEAIFRQPAVDIAEKDKVFEITAELPGLDVKNIEGTRRKGKIGRKGERQDQKKEKSKDYYLQERQYGAFERSFALPEGVDASKGDATFRNGILTITLPKTAEAQKPEQKVAVKAA